MCFCHLVKAEHKFELVFINNKHTAQLYLLHLSFTILSLVSYQKFHQNVVEGLFLTIFSIHICIREIDKDEFTECDNKAVSSDTQQKQ